MVKTRPREGWTWKARSRVALADWRVLEAHSPTALLYTYIYDIISSAGTPYFLSATLDCQC